jgi:hypothetical protein
MGLLKAPPSGSHEDGQAGEVEREGRGSLPSKSSGLQGT